jgi:hypothetical protein
VLIHRIVTIPSEPKYGEPPELGHWLTSYAQDVFQAIRLNGFSIKFNESYKFELFQGRYKQVFANDVVKIWEAPLSENIDDYGIR